MCSALSTTVAQLGAAHPRLSPHNPSMPARTLESFHVENPQPRAWRSSRFWRSTPVCSAAVSQDRNRERARGVWLPTHSLPSAPPPQKTKLLSRSRGPGETHRAAMQPGLQLARYDAGIVGSRWFGQSDVVSFRVAPGHPREKLQAKYRAAFYRAEGTSGTGASHPERKARGKAKERMRPPSTCYQLLHLAHNWHVPLKSLLHHQTQCIFQLRDWCDSHVRNAVCLLDHDEGGANRSSRVASMLTRVFISSPHICRHNGQQTPVLLLFDVVLLHRMASTTCRCNFFSIRWQHFEPPPSSLSRGA